MATAKKAAAIVAPVKAKKTEGTPLTPKLKKKLLDSTGLDCETEEEARTKMVAILAKSDINDVQGDSLEDIIDMVSAFPATEEEEEAIAAPVPKKKIVKVALPLEEVDEEQEAVDVERDTVEEEEEEAVPQPKAKKVAASPAKKKKVFVLEESTDATEEEETEELVEEVKAKGLAAGTAKKVGKKVAKKTDSERTHKLLGTHWETLDEAAKLKAVKPLRKFLPEKQFRIDFLTRSIICKYFGATSEHNIFKYHLLRLLPDGKLEGIFVSHRFKTPAEFAAYLPPAEEREGLKLNQGESCSYIHPFHIDAVIALFEETDFIKDSIAAATTTDSRMAANHKKLQAQMEGKKAATPAPAKKTGTAVAAKGKKVVEAVVEEEEATEEEEVPAPVKKVTAKIVPTAKPTAVVKGKKVVAPVEEEEAEEAEAEETPVPVKKATASVAKKAPVKAAAAPAKKK